MGSSKKKRTFIIIAASCLMVLAMMVTCGGPAFAQEQEQPAPVYTSFDQLDGKTIALLTGTPFEDLVRDKVKHPGSLKYLNSSSDMLQALDKGKIDAYLLNSATARTQVARGIGLAIFPEPLWYSQLGFAFAKGDPARDEWQAAYDRIPEETKADLWEEWTGPDLSRRALPAQDWPGKNGTVRVAACDSQPPLSYTADNRQVTGYDIEMALLMAKEMDVHLDLKPMEYNAVMPYVQKGKAVFGTGGIVVTDDRRQSLDFVEHTPISMVLVVPAEKGVSKAGLAERIKTSAQRTFLDDHRYKMLLAGLGVTLAVALSAGILGTLLAYGLVFVRKRNRKIFNSLIAVYTRLIAGIPAVVVLLVLYYVIFGSVDIPSMAVAIIGFTLIFGARAYGLIWNAVNKVDKGQMEAALALGFTEDQAFRSIILPQARDFYQSTLSGQFVGLTKETSIMGFIAAMDLTRAGDLIRSRTLEVFFPLLSVAAIYFVLTWLLTLALKKLIQYREKRREERKIKGVEV